jgi:hypothetical protein
VLFTGKTLEANGKGRAQGNVRQFKQLSQPSHPLHRIRHFGEFWVNFRIQAIPAQQ